jgi:hypothetical protein
MFTLILLFIAKLSLHVNVCDSRLVLPQQLNDNTWNIYNCNVKTILDPLHLELSSGAISPSTAAKQFPSVLSDYLSSEPDFSDERGGGDGRGRGGRRQVDMLDEALRLAKAEKKRLRKLVVGKRNVNPDTRRQFYEAVRTHNLVKKLRDQRIRADDAASQERGFLKDFWKFSKLAVAGKIGVETEKVSFSREYANEWYSNRYAVPVSLSNEAVKWFPSLPLPTSDFNLSAIKPRDVKRTLLRKKATSAPGDDGLLNGHLKHLDSTHHFLDTLFSKTLLDDPESWSGWGKSNISLIHKSGDTSAPENFRPIALTSVVV